MQPAIINVAFPSSGQEELLDALVRYFNLTKEGPATKNWIEKGRLKAETLNYCEYYNHCQIIGCSEDGINFQKNNDFGLKLEIDPKFNYLVQYRHPIETLIEYFKKGGKDDRVEWTNFANKQIFEWKKFINKWVINNTHDNVYHVSYSKLHFKPVHSLNQALELIDSSISIDSANAKKAVHKLGNPNCDIQNFKYFDPTFFNYLQELVREEMLFLNLEIQKFKNKEKDSHKVDMATVKHYVYYHDQKMLAKTQPVFRAPENIEYVDLNSLELPESLKVDGLSEKDNKAIFSEYFGHLLLEPITDMVGLFTYSIPLKFCKKHVDFLPKNKHLFQPYISFDLLKGKEFDPEKLYGAEFSSYDWDYDGREIIEEIDEHKDFHIAPKDNGNSGPFKGSIVVSKEKFLEFRGWFWKVTIYLLEKYGYSSGVTLKEENIGKYWAQEDLEYDVSFRRGIGQIQERLLAYYFGRTFHEKDKVDLKNFLNEDQFFKLVTYFDQSYDSRSILEKNIENPYIQELYVLYNKSEGTPQISIDKVHFIPHEPKPNITHLLEFANENFLIENCVIAGPDTEISDSIHKSNAYLKEQSLLLLSPYTKFDSGEEQLVSEKRFLRSEYNKNGAFFDRNSCAALAFRTPINQAVINNLNNGKPLMESFSNENYNFFNPCHEVKVYRPYKHIKNNILDLFNKQLIDKNGFLNPDHSRENQDKHWVSGEHQSSKTNLYTYFTPTHQILYDKWFKPSIKDDYNINVKICEQEAKNGVFEKTGWMNTMRQKNDLLVSAVEENMDDIFVFSDVDIQFFKRSKAVLIEELGDQDVLFQRDAGSSFGGPKMLGVACSGFFICRGNSRTKSFFKKVRATIENDDSIKGDQVAFNRVLEENPMKLKWNYLSSKFYSPGSVEAVLGENWVWKPGVQFDVPRDIVMHHANWTRGIENKIIQLEYVREQMTHGFYKSWVNTDDESEDDLIKKLTDKLRYTNQVEKIAISRAQKVNQISQVLRTVSAERNQIKEELETYKIALEEKTNLVEKQYKSMTWKIGSIFIKPIDFLLQKISKQ